MEFKGANFGKVVAAFEKPFSKTKMNLVHPNIYTYLAAVSRRLIQTTPTPPPKRVYHCSNCHQAEHRITECPQPKKA